MSGRNWADRLPANGANEDAGSRSICTPVPTFLATYHQYFDFVWSSAKYLGVGAESIDDIVQEVFMVVHSRIHTLQNADALRSWIYGIVRRTVSMHHRSNRVRTGLGASLSRWMQSRVPPSPTPFDLAEQTARVDLLASLLSRLDEAKREVFVAAELEEMTVPEIAEALEIPLNTAYSRLRAARQAFEEGLARRTAREKGFRGR